MDSLKYGKCRCCLAKGRHRDLNREYYHNGIREIFIDDFVECFNLFLSTNDALTTLICAACILNLRQACKFKKLVADTERKLLDSIVDNNEQQMVFVNVPGQDSTLSFEYEVKPEYIDVKSEESDHEFDSICDQVQQDDDIDCELKPCVKDDFLVEGEKELLSRFTSNSLKPLPTRQTLEETCPNYVRHLDLLKGIMVVPDMIKRLLKDNEPANNTMVYGNLYITEKLGQVVNVATLLEFSNITPFKSRGRNGFLCFYCPNIFEDASKLREHTLEHDKDEINRILKTYFTESLIVNVDVKDLKCTICRQEIVNLPELKSHLTGVHKKKMYSEFTDRVVPFKLSGAPYTCQVCECKFEMFGAIERHMNLHYRNYVCKECGTGFVTKSRLKVHIANTHVGETHPCDICGKIFASQTKYKNHVDSVHKMLKRFKCNKCPERFTEYVYRQKHLVEVHGVPRVDYKCNVCDKAFSRRYNLSTHMKRDHMEERNFHCDMCPYKCFSSMQLSMHMVKHNGERIFECSVCKKSYARKKTLKEHMRIHNNDRRYACAVCGQAFVQKCSLRGHMKTHHIEYEFS